MFRLHQSRVVFPALLIFTALWTGSCAIPLGPGYTIEKQAVDIRYIAVPEPRIELDASYQLRNSGNVALDILEVRLPRESPFRPAPLGITWDGQAISFERRTDTKGDIARIRLPGPWPVKQAHRLKLQYGFVQAGPQAPQLDFGPDSFYLPPDRWLATLQPPPGTFAEGGNAPDSWLLTLRVPARFSVQATGELKHRGRDNSEQVFLYQQNAASLTPFVVAGQYDQQEYDGQPYKVTLWSRTPRDAASAKLLAQRMQQFTKSYDALFGPRMGNLHTVWVADNPIPGKAWHQVTPEGSFDGFSFAVAPPGFGFIDHGEGGSPIWNQETTERQIGESLAKAWLGYGQSPDFESRTEPIRSLPEYAYCVAREAAEGTEVRAKLIREALKAYDDTRAFLAEQARDRKERGAGPGPPDLDFPAKSRMFYYALEDRFGRAHLHAALKFMVQARRNRSLELADMIAALEQETHQNAAEFARLWLKHPGIPTEFRARYEDRAALVEPEKNQVAVTPSKETFP